MATCGDGIVQAGVEACDDGNKLDTDDCTTLCTLPVCGDGFLHEGVEVCDDGADSPACDDDCSLVVCGDLHVNNAAGEGCDEGGVDTASCDADCTVAFCGDQQLNMVAGETCDDGGETANCDDDCTAPACGDGVSNEVAGEECDAAGNSKECDADCTLSMCGDGFVNPADGESCDDGNVEEGDGCSSACKAQKIVFASSATFDGNLGGLAGGDAKCQALAVAAGLKGTYRVWASDVTGTPLTRFTKANIPYARRDGVVVANNFADLIDGALLAPINLSELKTQPGFDDNLCGNLKGLTLTNTATDGTMFNALTSCNSWTSNNANGITGGGHWSASTANWTAFVCSQFCNWKKALYCFEQ